MSNSFSPLNSLNVLTPLRTESANTAGDHITTNTDNNHTGQSRPRRKCNKIGKLKIITINCRSLKSNRNPNGGGVFIAVKNNLIALEHKLDSHTGCEIMWIKLQSKVPDSC